MLSAYTIPIKGAFLIFPFLALLFTVPYVIYQYHKYGSFLVLRACIVYSFILYMTCACFMTILPLPPIEEVAQYTEPYVDLKIFGAWRDFWAYSSFTASDPSTWIAAVKEQVFYEPFFNLLLLLPLGIYLRYYFKRSWLQTLVISFCVSLSFELLQLSALFGIYPRPYRVFEVDDLIINTLGAQLGYWMTPLFSFFLPSREKLDEMAYRKGKKVSMMRRLIAFVFDWIILGMIIEGLAKILGTPLFSQMIVLEGRRSVLLYMVCTGVYFVAVSYLSGGRTFGKMLVNIRLVSTKKKGRREKPGLIQLMIRYGIEYYLILPAPFIEMKIYDMLTEGTGWPFGVLILAAVFFGLVFAFYIFQLFIGLLTGATRTINEVLSQTINVSGTDRRERKPVG